MPEPVRRRWIKLWTHESLTGTLRRELEPDERSIWWDFLALAGDSAEPGKICVYPGVPMTKDQLCQVLNVSGELLDRAMQKLIRSGRIYVNNGIIHIANWEKYQSEYERTKKYRKSTSKSTQQSTNQSDVENLQEGLHSHTETETRNRNEKQKKREDINYDSEEERIWIEVIREKEVKAVTKAKLMEHISQLREEYSDIDFNSELRKFRLYYSDNSKKLRKPRLALTNWMEKARREAGERQTRRNQPAREEPHEWA